MASSHFRGSIGDVYAITPPLHEMDAASQFSDFLPPQSDPILSEAAIPTGSVEGTSVQHSSTERRSRKALLIGASVLALVSLGGSAAGYSLTLSPSSYVYSGTEPHINKPHYQVYPLHNAKGDLQWPFVWKPFGNTAIDPIKAVQLGIDPKTVDVSTYDLALITAETRQVHQGTFTCKDGTTKTYISYGKLKAADLAENLCSPVVVDRRLAVVERIGKQATSRNTACDQFQNGDRILCEAQKYRDIYYKWAGGHSIGYQAFVKNCPNPRKPSRNQGYGAPAYNHNGNPSPCGLDCSGLVRMAVADAFHIQSDWTTLGYIRDKKHWKQIPVAQAKAGDIVTKGNPAYHVEIVRKIKRSKSGKQIIAYTFGTRAKGTKSGTSIGYYSVAYRYVGPGSR